MGQHKAKPEAPAKPLFSAITQRLASVKFAVGLVVVIAVACVAGTLLPQGAEVERYLRMHPAAADRMQLVGRLGLTHVFSSVWFIGLLCVLSASIATCSTRRFATMRRTTGYARWHAAGSMLTHISMLLILAGAVIRGAWGQKGYVELREGQTVASFMGDRGERPLPFTIHLANFEIETYDQQPEKLLVKSESRQVALPVKLGVEQGFEGFKITVLKYVPDFTVDMQTREITSRSSRPNNPAILVAVNGPTYQNHRWVFANFPGFDYGKPGSPVQLMYTARRADGPIKSFKSTLQLPDGEHVVEVNSPLHFGGYSFYQSGYNPNDLSYTSLQVIKDPGIPVVYAGFSLLIIGLGIVFYLNPWLNERRKQA